MTRVLAALLCAAAGVAAPQEPLTLTVGEAVAMAIRRNPSLSAAAREADAARAGVDAAKALANPSVVFAPGLTGPSGSDEELFVQQRLEINGARSARTGVARAQLQQTEALAAVELRDLVFETKRAYYELARAQALLALAEDVLGIAEEFDRGVSRRVEEGLQAGADEVQTGVEVSRARQQVAQARSQLQVAAAALNAVMGYPPDEPLGLLSPLTLATLEVDRDQAIQQALATRAEIPAQEALEQSFREEARLARAEGRIDIAPHLRAEGLIRGPQGIGVGLGIELPLFDHGGRRNRVRQAIARAEAQKAQTEAARVRIRQEVEQALARLEAAQARALEYEQGTREQARWLLEATLRGFQLGAPGSSVLTVLEAQRTFRAVEAEYTNALAEHALARAELERAMGTARSGLAPPGDREP